MSRDYRPRLVDERLDTLLSIFGGVLIVGPKWCGKSWTALNRARSEIYIDVQENRQRALLLPDSVLDGEAPRLVDEWQDAPGLWDAARRIIDKRHQAGLFIFTGSAVPPTQKTSHTGTGRFARLRMRPLSLYESGDSNGAVSITELFKTGSVEPAISELDLQKAVRLICKGGWPAGFWLSESGTLRIPREYMSSVINEDISRTDGVKRDPNLVALLLRSLARNTATNAKATNLKTDIETREGSSFSEQTIRGYCEALKRIFVLEEQDAWMPSLRSRSRIRVTPKRHFTDPSLAAAALSATPASLTKDIKTAGFLFESLCYRDLSVYMDVLNGRVFHYRDKEGLEADAILELGDGSWGAVEIKLGTYGFDAAAANLLRLKKKLGGDVPPPSFLAIVTASGGAAYQRDDGICVIPLDCLKP
ncbi:MAG: ATP-binding protein [Clostridiales Family XIII bacterium]|jgi:predicted AAA+ superfamily ATPase|nr:ATP-binding protein [Clostridiales Family XIII bacterium]